MCFQSKVVNNVLFLNQRLYVFKKSNAALEDEIEFYLYFYCPNVKVILNHLNLYLVEDFDSYIPMTARYCFWLFQGKDVIKNIEPYNHLFLLFKL